MTLFRFSHSGGIGGQPPPYNFFRTPLPPKLMPPMGTPPPPPTLKNEAPPSEKQTPQWNMKHHSMKSFLEAQSIITYNFTIKWLLHRYFYQHFMLSPCSPSCFDLTPSPASNFEEPPMFATPLGNPAFGGEKNSEVVIKATSFIKFFWKFKYTYYLAALVFVFIA